MLTDVQQRNGFVVRASRWPNGVVTYDIHRAFSEYCSTNIRSGMWGVEGNINLL